MKHLMPFVVALLSLTGAALRAQNTSASTQPKPPAGRRVLALAGREISGEQLEQMLAGSNREPDVKVAKQLSDLELTERLSAARLARCEANLRGPDARRALIALADRSSFLDPPIAEIPTIAEPDPQAQRRMIALSEDYVKKAIHQLPNLYATRVTIQATANGNLDESKVQEIAARQGATLSKLLVEKENFKSKVYVSVLNPEQRIKADKLQSLLA